MPRLKVWFSSPTNLCWWIFGLLGAAPVAAIIDEVASEYGDRMVVAKMNVDENPLTPGRFAIRAIPTLIVFKNGEVVEQVTGGGAKSNIVAMLEKALS